MQLDYDSAAPPRQAWRRRLNSHANILKEFSVTFMEAIKMVIFFICLFSMPDLLWQIKYYLSFVFES